MVTDHKASRAVLWPTRGQRSSRSSKFKGYTFKEAFWRYFVTYQKLPFYDLWPQFKIKGHPEVNIVTTLYNLRKKRHFRGIWPHNQKWPLNDLWFCVHPVTDSGSKVYQIMGSKVISSKFKEALCMFFITYQQCPHDLWKVKGNQLGLKGHSGYLGSKVISSNFKETWMFCYIHTSSIPLMTFDPCARSKVNIFSVMSPRYVIWGRTHILKVFCLKPEMTPKWPLTPNMCTPYRHWL